MKFYSNKHFQIFLALLRAGLWEKDVELQKYGATDFVGILRHAEEQSVVGLIAAGMEHIVDVKAPKELVLTMVGEALQLEHRNKAMNTFIAELIERMRMAGIAAVLVKGQGIAQCYERPLWRSSGDVDLLLSENNYERAKSLLMPLASHVEQEDIRSLHLGMFFDPWVVELHGSMFCEITDRINRVIKDVQDSIIDDERIRLWKNGTSIISLPSPDNDCILVFTHFINHFLGEGIGLRQICDWCRLLWTFRNSIDLDMLEDRINKSGLMSEWKSFAALAVNYLGMPAEVMPFYCSAKKWNRKANLVLSIIMRTGNFGHNNSFRVQSSLWIRKISSFTRQTNNSIRLICIFPCHAISAWWRMTINGLHQIGMMA